MYNDFDMLNVITEIHNKTLNKNLKSMDLI